MRRKKIGIYLAVAGIVAAMAGMAGCSMEGQTTEQLAVPKEEEGGTENEGEAAGPASGEGGTDSLTGGTGIQGQVQAPEWYETELSEGSVTVCADAAVILPEGAGFQTYRVTGRPFNQEDFDRVSRVLLKDAPLWERDMEAMAGSNGFTRSEIEKRIERLKNQAAGNENAVADDGKNQTYGEKISGWEKLLALAPEEPVFTEVPAVVPYVKKTEAGEDTLEANSLDGNATVDGEDYWISLTNNYQSDWLWAQMSVRSVDRSLGDNYRADLNEGTLAEGLSPDEIREQAVSLMREMGFTDFEPAGEEYFQALSGDEETGELTLGNIGYGIHFTRSLENIPVTYTHEQGLGVEEDDVVWPYERLDMVFDEKGLADFVWWNPCEIEKLSDEYVFLMPFSDIRDIFEEMILQKYQWITENGDVSARFDIKEVRLGYMRIREDAETDEGKLIPVWDFLGTQTLSYGGETEPLAYGGSYESWLTIDATDGRIIDRGLGY